MTYSRSKWRPITKEDRELRKANARKVEARTAFLDNLQDLITAECGICGQRLGWWKRDDDSGEWRSQPLIPFPMGFSDMGFSDPGEAVYFSYGDYPDTGYTVHIISDTFAHSGTQRRRIRTTGGMLSRGGQRIGRRPRTNDPSLTKPGFGIPQLMVSRVVTLPADVFCPVCERTTLNAIPVLLPDTPPSA
jgi:hypothetical protein